MNLRNYDDDFLDCREDRHMMSGRHLVQLADMPARTVGVRTTCARCEYTLTKLVRNGEIVGYRRSYPDGYLVHGEGRMDTVKRRKEVLRRLTANPKLRRVS